MGVPLLAGAAKPVPVAASKGVEKMETKVPDVRMSVREEAKTTEANAQVLAKDDQKNSIAAQRRRHEEMLKMSDDAFVKKFYNASDSHRPRSHRGTFTQVYRTPDTPIADVFDYVVNHKGLNDLLVSWGVTVPMLCEWRTAHGLDVGEVDPKGRILVRGEISHQNKEEPQASGRIFATTIHMIAVAVGNAYGKRTGHCLAHGPEFWALFFHLLAVALPDLECKLLSDVDLKRCFQCQFSDPNFPDSFNQVVTYHDPGNHEEVREAILTFSSKAKKHLSVNTDSIN